MKRALFAPLALAALFAPLAAVAHDARQPTRDLRFEVTRDYRSVAPRPSSQALPRSTRYAYSRPAPRYQPPRGHAPSRHWRAGQVMPVQYRAAPYVVDYRHYRLPPPPRGYHYVRVNNDAVLVAIASGLIAEVLMQALYR